MPGEAFTYRSKDGLTLAGTAYGAGNPGLPVVCLPGLTRTTRDFALLGRALEDTGRQAVAFDYRGRGRSGRDPTGLTYTVPVELDDVVTGMEARGLGRSILVGTSRGGIIAMSMALARPDLVAGAVLVDIGSRIETAGLLRIKSYVGKSAPPLDFGMAAGMLRALNGESFPAFSDADWQEQARLTFADEGGKPVADYDPALAAGMAALTEATPAIDLTHAFDALAGVPVMVIRGATSDLLSPATVAEMAARHPGLVAIEVPGEGHVPMLRGGLVTAIVDFARSIG
ncbi:alpha/beta hydrolase [Kaistia geumhonensis]|uniref:Pimeloyl-ACP methyl ester carboxylesterase n=1 Tax=Kaistia geumhonensis TaxID=410839 RepID=A0ABU0M3F6_9HYPH|nr:alpha/beta hydrolase [Kaistia geumhonensis]MCX5479394.1 alpha/beta hydrolase [Kaistia geumhonensis]MDQ0515383.1 pimeloyl-ACP methyl ester carboxylesterase [Kaistia geumhonensis]